MAPARTSTPLLIVFMDLTRFNAQIQRQEDVDVADTLDAYYQLLEEAVRESGGKLVKFIGDAALAVFPEGTGDAAVRMLLALKEEVDQFMAARHWECRLNVKVHFGTVMAGLFGTGETRRYDVIGKAVNTTAILQSQGVTLSVEGFRQLGHELRQRFKKHTPPVTYIRAEDPRPMKRR